MKCVANFGVSKKVLAPLAPKVPILAKLDPIGMLACTLEHLLLTGTHMLIGVDMQPYTHRRVGFVPAMDMWRTSECVLPISITLRCLLWICELASRKPCYHQEPL